VREVDAEKRAEMEGEPAAEPVPVIEAAGAESREDSPAQGTPGTTVVRPYNGDRDEEPPRTFKTIHVSSSAKARASIRTCDKCRHDNIPEAKFCEGCGDDLDEQEQKKEFEASMKQLDDYAEKAAKVRPKKDGRTILRRYKTPVMHPAVDVEKRSYHSHYIPSGTPAVQQFDPAGFRSDQVFAGHQDQPQQLYPPQGYAPQGMQQYVAVPVNYELRPVATGRSTSFIVGVILLSLLALVLIGLVVTIIVLA
jgi:hypothetical protein